MVRVSIAYIYWYWDPLDTASPKRHTTRAEIIASATSESI